MAKKELEQMVAIKEIKAVDQDKELLAIQAKMGDLVKRAQDYRVTSNKAFDGAQQIIDWIADQQKIVKARQDVWLKPLKIYIKEREAFFKSFMKPLSEANAIIRDKMVAYRQKVIEEQRAAAEAAAKQNKVPVEEVLASNQEQAPATAGSTFVKIVDQDKIQAAIDKGIYKIPGVNIYQVWEFEVDDPDKVPDEYKKETVRRTGGRTW